MGDQLKRKIGLRVKSARTEKGMTQAQLAEAIDKAFETISNIERGKTAPNFSTLEDIAKVLGLPMRDFFDAELADGSEHRQDLLMQVNSLVAKMTDSDLALLVKLGQVVQDQRAS
jgi:transcriptional regulator with XRE-family HTH domain